MSAGEIVYYTGIGVMLLVSLFVMVGFAMAIVGVVQLYWGTTWPVWGRR